MKLNYGKTFLLGFGFIAVSVIWATYNDSYTGRRKTRQAD